MHQYVLRTLPTSIVAHPRETASPVSALSDWATGDMPHRRADGASRSSRRDHTGWSRPGAWKSMDGFRSLKRHGFTGWGQTGHPSTEHAAATRARSWSSRAWRCRCWSGTTLSRASLETRNEVRQPWPGSPDRLPVPPRSCPVPGTLGPSRTRPAYGREQSAQLRGFRKPTLAGAARTKSADAAPRWGGKDRGLRRAGTMRGRPHRKH
jgi:hypothetical protein